MLVLFDINTPRGLARVLKRHTVVEARARGWERYENGALLNAAGEAGFEVLVTSDKRIRYQQNLTGRKIALVVLSQGRWRLVRQRLEEIAAAVDAATAGSYTEVEVPIN